MKILLAICNIGIRVFGHLCRTDDSLISIPQTTPIP